MRNRILFSVLLLALCSAAQADVYIYNTTDERMTYQVLLPNGDTKEGVIKENTGYYPAQTTISTPEGKVTTFKVFSETGKSGMKVQAPYARSYLIGMKGGKLKFKAISWHRDNGQTQKRQMTIYNATGVSQTFDLVDEKELRKITLEPGEEKTVSAKHGFNGASGFHDLKFPGGHRLSKAISSGYYCILYMDKRSPGKVQADNYGHLAMPRNTVLP